MVFGMVLRWKSNSARSQRAISTIAPERYPSTEECSGKGAHSKSNMTQMLQVFLDSRPFERAMDSTAIYGYRMRGRAYYFLNQFDSASATFRLHYATIQRTKRPSRSSMT